MSALVIRVLGWELVSITLDSAPTPDDEPWRGDITAEHVGFVAYSDRPENVECL